MLHRRLNLSDARLHLVVTYGAVCNRVHVCPRTRTHTHTWAQLEVILKFILKILGVDWNHLAQDRD